MFVSFAWYLHRSSWGSLGLEPVAAISNFQSQAKTLPGRYRHDRGQRSSEVRLCCAQERLRRKLTVAAPTRHLQALLPSTLAASPTLGVVLAGRFLPCRGCGAGLPLAKAARRLPTEIASQLTDGTFAGISRLGNHGHNLLSLASQRASAFPPEGIESRRLVACRMRIGPLPPDSQSVAQTPQGAEIVTAMKCSRGS